MSKRHGSEGIFAVLMFLFSGALLLPYGEARTYTTNFQGTESPISENGNWINGKASGLDWADVSTVPGLAIGTESGSNGYDDSTALLKGAWGPDQTVTATVYARNQRGNKFYEEVEIRLRSSISPRRCAGYEILFRSLKGPDSYVQIVRWNGPLGDFTYLADQKGIKCGISNGDTVKATIVGNVITAYINNVQVAQAVDSTYPSGNPGMGFFIQGTPAANRDYGFSSLTASDEPGALNPEGDR
jgi:hypothetical protein